MKTKILKRINLQRNIRDPYSIHQNHLQPTKISWDYPFKQCPIVAAIVACAQLCQFLLLYIEGVMSLSTQLRPWVRNDLLLLTIELGCRSHIWLYIYILQVNIQHQMGPYVFIHTCIMHIHCFKVLCCQIFDFLNLYKSWFAVSKIAIDKLSQNWLTICV